MRYLPDVVAAPRERRKVGMTVGRTVGRNESTPNERVPNDPIASDPASSIEARLGGGIEVVGVAIKPGAARAEEAARDLAKWLRSVGLRVLYDPPASVAVGAPATAHAELVRAAGLLVVLGGDGTLLSLARALGERAVPILGINLGTLGFLAEVSVDEMVPALERALGGSMGVERRMRIEVEHLRNGSPIGRWLALNDAVVTSSVARLIEIETRADGRLVSTYHADGLIASTPTGSTAYSLSAGGPILLPSLDALVLTPICPHTLTQRPLVIPDSVVLEIEAKTGAKARLTVDGQAEVGLEDRDVVRVRRSAHDVLLVVPPQRSRFDVLRAKLRWGER
jgi:NAD+ kinase